MWKLIYHKYYALFCVQLQPQLEHLNCCCSLSSKIQESPDLEVENLNQGCLLWKLVTINGTLKWFLAIVLNRWNVLIFHYLLSLKLLSLTGYLNVFIISLTFFMCLSFLFSEKLLPGIPHWKYYLFLHEYLAEMCHLCKRFVIDIKSSKCLYSLWF